MNRSKPLLNNRRRVAQLLAVPLALLPLLTAIPLPAQSGASAEATSVVPAPKPPLVASLPAGMKWLIALTPKQAPQTSTDEKPKRQLKTIQGERSATLRREVYEWSDLSTERWYVGHLVLATAPGRSDIIPTSYPRNEKLTEARLGGFPDLNWIAMEHYKGVVTRKKLTCYLYEYTEVAKAVLEPAERDLIAQGKMAAPEDTVYLHRAWIDTATLLPVAFENTNYLMEFEFSRGGGNPSLPTRFLDAARKIDPTIAP